MYYISRFAVNLASLGTNSSYILQTPGKQIIGEFMNTLNRVVLLSSFFVIASCGGGGRRNDSGSGREGPEGGGDRAPRADASPTPVCTGSPAAAAGAKFVEYV